MYNYKLQHFNNNKNIIYSTEKKKSDWAYIYMVSLVLFSDEHNIEFFAQSGKTASFPLYS